MESTGAIRLAWDTAAAGLRAEVGRLLGGPVVLARGQSGGFSQGVAARVTADTGATAFVKGVPADGNAGTVRLFRREAEIAAALPAGLPAPRLLAHLEVDGWVALVFTDVPGRIVSTPWSAPDTGRVLASVLRLAELGTPCPVRVVDAWGGPLDSWPGWCAMASPPRGLDPCWLPRLERLADWERRYPDAVAGDTLLHADLRSDNIILSGDGVTFVDWAWAARGQAWIDPLIFALCGAVQGMGDPDQVFLRHPAGRSAEPDAVDCVLAALAGRFVNAAAQPADGMARLRAFQAAEASVTLGWLAARHGWR